MKFFLDTEFIESGPSKPIQLISIGIVAEDGREFYAISSEWNEEDASQWVSENVIAKLRTPPGDYWKPLRMIADELIQFVWTYFPENPAGLSPCVRSEMREAPEFWGYYADYDWVVFCQIFGTMMDLPKGFPMYCRDIKQLCDDKGNPKLPEQCKGEHNALADARWNKTAWEFLDSLAGL